MSLIEQFESMIVRKNYQKTYDVTKNKFKEGYSPLLTCNRLSHSYYDNNIELKSNASPSKPNQEKFIELRRKLALKGNDKSKRVAMRSTMKDIFHF